MQTMSQLTYWLSVIALTYVINTAVNCKAIRKWPPVHHCFSPRTPYTGEQDIPQGGADGNEETFHQLSR